MSDPYHLFVLSLDQILNSLQKILFPKTDWNSNQEEDCPIWLIFHYIIYKSLIAHLCVRAYW